MSIDGLPAPDGTAVTAWMDGALAATALTTNGAAIIRIEGDGSDSGRAISFTIGVLTGGAPGGLMEYLDAAEVDFWEQGGHVDKNFAISVYTAPRTPAEAFAPLIDHLVDGRANLLGVFWFNDETQSYLSYDPDPDFAFFNNLETVESQQTFWLRLRAPQHFLGKNPPRWLERGGVAVGGWRGRFHRSGRGVFILGLLTRIPTPPVQSHQSRPCRESTSPSATATPSSRWVFSWACCWQPPSPVPLAPARDRPCSRSIKSPAAIDLPRANLVVADLDGRPIYHASGSWTKAGVLSGVRFQESGTDPCVPVVVVP